VERNLKGRSQREKDEKAEGWGEGRRSLGGKPSFVEMDVAGEVTPTLVPTPTRC